MPHNIPLITTIAAALGFGLLFSMIAVRLKLPALVGYLAAGIVIGPATPGFVADVALAGQLAEIGVMLLMFGVGLHFSLDDLLEVRGIALPGAILQIAVATVMGMGLAHLWGWSLGAGLIFGLALSVASTVGTTAGAGRSGNRRLDERAYRGGMAGGRGSGNGARAGAAAGAVRLAGGAILPHRVAATCGLRLPRPWVS